MKRPQPPANAGPPWVGAVLDEAPTLILVTLGEEHRVAYASRRALEAATRPLHPVGRPLAEAFPWLAGNGLREVFDAALRDGETRTVDEARVIAPPATPGGDPEERVLHCAWKPWRDRVGEVRGVAFHAVDVTACVRAREAAEAAQQRLDMLLADLDVVTWEMDLPSERFTYVSEKASRLLGHPPSSWKDFGSWEDMVHPDDREEAARTCRAATERGEDHRLEYRMVDHEGGVHWIEDIVRVVRGEDGRPTALRGVLVDISARKALELERMEMDQRLLQVQKLESLGVLAGGIAHDFNNILTGILGNASVALMDLPPTHPARGRVEALMTAARRAADLANQMLAYSGRGHFHVAPVDVDALLREVVDLLVSSIPKKVQVHLDLAGDLPPVQADASQLQQVFMNLVLNGAEAIGDEHGTVLVSTSVQVVDENYAEQLQPISVPRPGAYVCIEVHDTGCGMDAETRKRVFDPFFTTKSTGRGLGLAAVQGIVRGHGGAIRLYSTPGRGTSFKVLLPADGEPPAPHPEPDPAPAPQGGHVLVIDDEETVRSTAVHMLRALGFEVMAAATGQEGLDLHARHAHELDAILLDMTMPDMGGAEVFQVLRARGNTVPVILSSGYNEVEATRRFAGKGLAGFLQKPYTLDELRRALARRRPPPGEPGKG